MPTYPDYTDFKRKRLVCCDFLHGVHQNTTHRAQVINVKVDGNMSAQEIRFWVSAAAPDPQQGGTPTTYVMLKDDKATQDHDFHVAHGELIWAALDSDQVRTHFLKLTLR